MTVAVADVSADNGSVCIRLSGEIDRANVSAVEEQLRAAVSGQRTAVSVDLANVIYIDSTGKQLLFDLALLLQGSHIVLEIIVPFDSPIRRLIELAGLQSIAALVLVHRPDSSQVGLVELVLPAQPWALKNIRHALRRWLSGAGASLYVVDDVLIAVGEACANVVDHVYGTERGTVNVHLGFRGQTCWRPSQIRVSGGSRRWEIEDGERCLCAIVPMICGSIVVLLARRWLSVAT